MNGRPAGFPRGVSSRRARPADAAALFRVRVSVRENYQSEAGLAEVGVTPGSVAALLESSDARGWCIEADGAIVAFALARVSERDLFALFVDPGHQGRGYGTALLARAVRWLHASGIDTARLSTGRRTRAIDFYLKRGWRDVSAATFGDAVLESPRWLRSHPQAK